MYVHTHNVIVLFCFVLSTIEEGKEGRREDGEKKLSFYSYSYAPLSASLDDFSPAALIPGPFPSPPMSSPLLYI